MDNRIHPLSDSLEDFEISYIPFNKGDSRVSKGILNIGKRATVEVIKNDDFLR